MFELANNAKNYVGILSTLLDQGGLAPVDRVICIYGLSGKIPGDESNEKMVALITQLLKSGSERERQLALEVCHMLPANKRIPLIMEAFKASDSKAFKKALVRLLEEFSDENSWKAFRSLAASEQDPELRDSLRSAEQLLRDINSSRRSRANWNRITDSRAIRETIWKWRK